MRYRARRWGFYRSQATLGKAREPVGERGDSVISPFARATCNVPVDVADESPILVKFGAHLIRRNLDAGVAKGKEARRSIDTGYSHSGRYEMMEETIAFSANHQDRLPKHYLATRVTRPMVGRIGKPRAIAPTKRRSSRFSRH